MSRDGTLPMIPSPSGFASAFQAAAPFFLREWHCHGTYSRRSNLGVIVIDADEDVHLVSNASDAISVNVIMAGSGASPITSSQNISHG